MNTDATDATDASSDAPDATPTPTPTPSPVAAPTAAPPPPPRRVISLRRSRSDRWIGGVCGGIAERLGMDVTIVRLLAVLTVIFGHVITVIAYLACWALLPEDGD